MSDVTVTNDPPPPAPNTMEARTPDGTLKDASGNTTPTPTPEPPTNGDSFLTGKEPAADANAKPDDKPADPSAGAPEKYADFKLPDGYTLDAESGAKAQALFKELNLSQEAAQKAVDFYAANAIQAAEAPYKAWADLQKQWTSEIANLYPGDKAKEVKGMISGVIDTALPPTLARDFRAALDLTGAGSHPAVVQAFAMLFKNHAEGRPVKGNGPAPTGQKAPGAPERPSIAEAMYPHLTGNRPS